MYFSDIKEAIDDQIEHWSRGMPSDIRALIDLANSDLYYGPVYLDANGERCSCFDDDARPFDFSGAVAKIGEYLEEVEDLRIETDFDPETEESVFERVDGSSAAIIAGIVGKELSRYL